MSRDPYTLFCDVTAHALYNNDSFADTKKTLPQHCCVARVLAAAQQCLEQIRHNILTFRIIIFSIVKSPGR
jgi:hypothetical protein